MACFDPSHEPCWVRRVPPTLEVIVEVKEKVDAAFVAVAAVVKAACALLNDPEGAVVVVGVEAAVVGVSTDEPAIEGALVVEVELPKRAPAWATAVAALLVLPAASGHIVTFGSAKKHLYGQGVPKLKKSAPRCR
jgi:hypothetical protein